MTVDEINIIFLDLFNLSYERKVKILKLFSVGVSIIDNLKDKELELRKIIPQEEIEKMQNSSSSDFINKILDKYRFMGLKPITIMSKSYPERLKNITNPPLCLYCKGNIQLLDTKCVGIVGTRHPTDYGKVVTKKIATELAESGLTIVSGLANGVDTIAHKSSLDVEGSTIAVIAGGHNNVYPKANERLFATICENNLVISEYPPDTLNLAYLFPIRNRIIAGLSDAVVITEASSKSGTMHTKNYAIDFGKEVFAVPGNINSLQSEGCNNSIRDMQAIPLLDSKQVLDSMNITLTLKKGEQISLDKTAKNILDYIGSNKKSFDDIQLHTNLSSSDLNIMLLELELSGKVQKLAGNYYMGI